MNPEQPTGIRAAPRWRRAVLALEPARRVDDPRLEWRRLFAEVFGTFLLVLVACGAVLVDVRSGGAIGRLAAVTAPGLMVMAVILFMGGVSGAHLNPVVTIGFTLRRDFPWRRVPGYILAQCVGAILACLLLRGVLGSYGALGATEPGLGVTGWEAMVIETILTVGLISTILGTASRAQNVGPLSAVAIGGYIVLAGLWASPVTGASMNPARSLGPDLVIGDYANLWIYIAGPAAGMALAVLFAWVLRGPGGYAESALAARGRLEEMLKGR